MGWRMTRAVQACPDSFFRFEVLACLINEAVRLFPPIIFFRQEIFAWETFTFSMIFQGSVSWHVVVSSPQHGEKTAFFSSFPLADVMVEAFCWLFPWNFKKESANHFLGRVVVLNVTIFNY